VLPRKLQHLQVPARSGVHASVRRHHPHTPPKHLPSRPCARQVGGRHRRPTRASHLREEGAVDGIQPREHLSRKYLGKLRNQQQQQRNRGFSPLRLPPRFLPVLLFIHPRLVFQPRLPFLRFLMFHPFIMFLLCLPPRVLLFLLFIQPRLLLQPCLLFLLRRGRDREPGWGREGQGQRGQRRRQRRRRASRHQGPYEVCFPAQFKQR